MKMLSKITIAGFKSFADSTVFEFDKQIIGIVGPNGCGKSNLVEKIAEAAKDKRIEGISDIRDESSREGVRVVIDLKRDATPEVVLNQIWRHTPAQSSFPANMLAIRGGRPETLTLRDIVFDKPAAVMPVGPTPAIGPQ